jgi:hypothetical protein
MELASMLAGEPFSDHPDSVSPVIGSVLRAYNDSIDDYPRQALYGYASKVVGSRSSSMVERARAERLLAWASGLQPRWGRLLHWRRLRLTGNQRQTDVVAAIGVRSLSRRNDHHHTELLALVDEMLATGRADAPRHPDHATRASTVIAAADRVPCS